jgi:hypothetical protein
MRMVRVAAGRFETVRRIDVARLRGAGLFLWFRNPRRRPQFSDGGGGFAFAYISQSARRVCFAVIRELDHTSSTVNLTSSTVCAPAPVHLTEYISNIRGEWEITYVYISVFSHF